MKWLAALTRQPPTQISKCRCGPVASPVCPTRQIGWPAATGAPGAIVTGIEPSWQWAKNMSRPSTVWMTMYQPAAAGWLST